MMLVPCPWCGSRNVSEFAHVGESTPRPDPSAATPPQWRAYLYERDNPCGRTSEYWYHRAGCRRYFSLERDTATNQPLGRAQKPATHASTGGSDR